jgi:hypothetical protein
VNVSVTLADLLQIGWSGEEMFAPTADPARRPPNPPKTIQLVIAMPPKSCDEGGAAAAPIPTPTQRPMAAPYQR